MKIGILAQYLETRPDVRELMNSLQKKFTVVLFLRQRDSNAQGLIDERITSRLFNESLNKYNNYLWDKLFSLFGILPASRNNYFITEEFKLHNMQLSGFYFFIEKAILAVSRFTPKFISYKNYLKHLRTDENVELDDIDVFFCITQIYDNAFYARLQRSGKRIVNYVYSWDHPCKMKCFLPGEQRNIYLVWSDGIKQDLINLQGIDEDQILISGATQFIYLSDYLKSTSGVIQVKNNNRKIYFAFATGTDFLIKQELELLNEFIQILSDRIPDLIFYVRPYPFVKDPQIYNSLRSYKNVIIDTDDGRVNSSPHSVYYKKYTSISECGVFLHFGTTLALEAAHLDIPVFLCDMAGTRASALNKFIHQYQNDKYLNLPFSQNVLHNKEQLIAGITDALYGKFAFQDYNNSLKAVAPAEPIEILISRFAGIFEN